MHTPHRSRRRSRRRSKYRCGDLRHRALSRPVRLVPGGGTSLASPIVAAVYALAGNGANTIDGSYSYSHLSGLFDVVSGSNGSCGGSYLCTGKAGYDGPTGNGTPNGTSAF